MFIARELSRTLVFRFRRYSSIAGGETIHQSRKWSGGTPEETCVRAPVLKSFRVESLPQMAGEAVRLFFGCGVSGCGVSGCGVFGAGGMGLT
jgi:hypothetical protein